jgi:hypothetical protein
MQFKVKIFSAVAAGVLCGSSMILASALSAAGSVSSLGANAGGRALPAPGPAGRASIDRGNLGLLYFYNWSGYAQAVTKGTIYKSVTDTWKVPTVNTSVSGDQDSSDWVGIGGFKSGDTTLVQAGTEADNIGGTAEYDAWTEILPASEVVVPGLTIHPGDTIKTTVALVSGKWKMTVKDVTTGKSGGRTVKYHSSEVSVEAVHERPEVGGSLSDLAQTTNVTFDPGKYGTSATPTKALLVPASGATVDQMFMVNNTDTAIVASPSSPDSDNDGFAVADGSTSPPPPSS